MKSSLKSESYWHTYYDASTIEHCAALRQEFYLSTADQSLHVDGYLQADSNAPLILLTHGEGQYSGMFVRAALALHERGISVLVLDQRAHGRSSGRGLDFSLAQLSQDVLDAAHWARRTFSGPIFLGGVGLGSWLAYQASAMGAPVIGLALHELYDLTSPRESLAASRLAGLAALPGGVAFTGAAARALLALSPHMRLRHATLARFEGLLDERDNGNYEAWLEDPNPPRQVSIRYAVSALSAPLALPYEDNALPVLVTNPTRDRMVDPAITRRCFERLGGPKTYQELDFGHWSMLESFARQWSAAVERWMSGVLVGPSDYRAR